MIRKVLDYLIWLPYSRKDFIKNIKKEHSVLEIGPYTTPWCFGKNVKYFDILSQEELEADAKKNTHPTRQFSEIPHIDYVSKTGDLSVIKEKFDRIVSSHVIEHQPDLVKHLNQVSLLLKDGGQYCVVIPDKRYCYDHFIPVSSIADVVESSQTKREKHTLMSTIEHLAMMTHNDPLNHWLGIHGKLNKNLASEISSAIKKYQENSYIDVHAWQFTPNSFKEIIKILKEMGLINLKIKEIHPTTFGKIEFYVILEKC